MKRSTLLYGALALAIAGGALAWAFVPAPVAVDIAPVTRGRFEAGIEEDGRTRLRDRYVVSAPLAGRLARIGLREGDPVDADAPLAIITPGLPPLLDARTVLSQQARVASAQAVVQRALARIERGKVSVEQARADLARTEQLAARGFVAPTRLDTERLVERAARRELDAAVADHDAARHDLEQAQASLAALQEGSAPARKVEQVVLRAPAPGRVLRVVQPNEANVLAGAPLIEVGDTRRLEVVAELLTTDALQIHEGSRVIIDRWGGPDRLEGRVRRIEPSAFTKVSALGVEEQRVAVLIDILSPADTWRALGDGYRVGVRILTVARDDALLVPVSASFPMPAGLSSMPAAPTAAAGAPPQSAVFVVQAGRAQLKGVDIAARNATHAWVRSGLDAGDPVIAYPPPAVRDGTRVRPRSP